GLPAAPPGPAGLVVVGLRSRPLGDARAEPARRVGRRGLATPPAARHGGPRRHPARRAPPPPGPARPRRRRARAGRPARTRPLPGPTGRRPPPLAAARARRTAAARRGRDLRTAHPGRPARTGGTGTDALRNGHGGGGGHSGRGGRYRPTDRRPTDRRIGGRSRPREAGRSRPVRPPGPLGGAGRTGQRSPAKRSFSGTGAPVGSWTRTKVSTPINSVNRSLPILRKKMFSPWPGGAGSAANLPPPDAGAA